MLLKHSMYPKVVMLMSDFHLYVLSVLVGITILTMLLALRRKKHLTLMAAMIVSMFLGMSVGLTAGIMFGAIFQGNLYISTILGMIFGITAGAMGGGSFNLISLIEGILSGLMAGMMGAMLGEMIPVEQANMFIKMFLLMSCCTIYLLIILSTSPKDTINKMSTLIQPISVALIIGFVLLLGNSFEKEVLKFTSPTSENGMHHVSDKETLNIVIETAEMNYSPNEIVVEKNKPTTFQLINSDQVEHDIEIVNLSFKTITKSTHHTHHHEVLENVLHLHAEAQKSSETTVIFNESGTYEFYCTIPGHKESGMIGQLVVH